MPSSAATASTAISTLSLTPLFRSEGAGQPGQGPRSGSAHPARFVFTGVGADARGLRQRGPGQPAGDAQGLQALAEGGAGPLREAVRDRKSTRLNSSHMSISYAVFCCYGVHRDLHSFPHAALPI